jgi:pimeloyl-ACP methyl ester carboxylesterase
VRDNIRRTTQTDAASEPISRTYTSQGSDGRAAFFRDHRTVVFEKAGHWVHHDELDAFLAALHEFL